MRSYSVIWKTDSRGFSIRVQWSVQVCSVLNKCRGMQRACDVSVIMGVRALGTVNLAPSAQRNYDKTIIVTRDFKHLDHDTAIIHRQITAFSHDIGVIIPRPTPPPRKVYIWHDLHAIVTFDSWFRAYTEPDAEWV